MLLEEICEDAGIYEVLASDRKEALQGRTGVSQYR
jgi:hypothetical protein